MAEYIVKSIKTDKEPKRPVSGLEDLPESKQTARPLKENKTEKKRPRAGSIQMGINPYGKMVIVEDGRKIK